MTVPAILCDALPAQNQKVQAHTNRFAKQRECAQNLGDHRGHDELSPKPVGLVRSKPGAPSMMGRNAQSNSGLKKPLRIPVTRLTGNFIAVSLSKSLIERRPPAYVGGPDKT